MVRIALLLPLIALASPTGVASAAVNDPSTERAGEQHQLQPVRKRERAKPAPAAPCTGCATQPSSQPPMLEAPVPGLLLIPAEGAGI